MTDYTGPTEGFYAAIQANNTVLSFAKEETYRTTPTGIYQRARLTGENFRPEIQRQRPDEINALAEASQAVTTQVSVSGTLSGALSYGTYDDFLAAVLCADWNGNSLLNSTIVKTWSIVEQLGDQYFIRPGAFCTRAQLTFSQGNTSQVAFDFTASEQTTATAHPGSSISDATSTLILDTVTDFGGMTVDGTSPSSCIKELQITIDRNGSGADYGMGHPDACGIRPGETLVSGQVQLYFKDWVLYGKYADNWAGKLEAKVHDKAGNGYVFTFLNASLLNPVINAGSKNSSIVATFDIEANPQPGGGTFQITRHPTASVPPASGSDETSGQPSENENADPLSPAPDSDTANSEEKAPIAPSSENDNGGSGRVHAQESTSDNNPPLGQTTSRKDDASTESGNEAETLAVPLQETDNVNEANAEKAPAASQNSEAGHEENHPEAAPALDSSETPAQPQ